jgi:hypothetical protein
MTRHPDKLIDRSLHGTVHEKTYYNLIEDTASVEDLWSNNDLNVVLVNKW